MGFLQQAVAAHTISALCYHPGVAPVGKQTAVLEWKHGSGIRTAKAESLAENNLRGETDKQLHIHKNKEQYQT